MDLRLLAPKKSVPRFRVLPIHAIFLAVCSTYKKLTIITTYKNSTHNNNNNNNNTVNHLVWAIQKEEGQQHDTKEATLFIANL